KMAAIPYPVAQPIQYDSFLSSNLRLPVQGRHSEGVNIGYLDGHAKFFRVARNLSPQLFDSAFNRYIDTWYINTGPFRSPCQDKINYEFWRIVTDPECANPTCDNYPVSKSCLTDTRYF